LRRKQYQQAESQHDGDKAKIGENTDSHILSFFPVLKRKQLAPWGAWLITIWMPSFPYASYEDSLGNHSV
jgi:hypothetical protein